MDIFGTVTVGRFRIKCIIRPLLPEMQTFVSRKSSEGDAISHRRRRLMAMTVNLLERPALCIDAMTVCTIVYGVFTPRECSDSHVKLRSHRALDLSTTAAAESSVCCHF